jgi:hypothetical protein
MLKNILMYGFNFNWSVVRRALRKNHLNGVRNRRGTNYPLIINDSVRWRNRLNELYYKTIRVVCPQRYGSLMRLIFKSLFKENCGSFIIYIL